MGRETCAEGQWHGGDQIVVGDQCQYNAQDRRGAPIKKPTKFMTNSPAIADQFEKALPVTFTFVLVYLVVHMHCATDASQRGCYISV